MGKCRMSRESLESLESQDLLRQDERNYWTTMEKVLSKGGKNLVSIETQNQARSGNSALGFQETRTSVKLTHAKGTNYFFFFLQVYLICFNPKTDIDKDGSQLSYCPLKHPFAVENGKGCCHAIMENIP